MYSTPITIKKTPSIVLKIVYEFLFSLKKLKMQYIPITIEKLPKNNNSPHLYFK